MLLANFRGILVVENKGISPEMLIVIKGGLNGNTNVRLQVFTFKHNKSLSLFRGKSNKR